jgi:hypothetical protein
MFPRREAAIIGRDLQIPAHPGDVMTKSEPQQHYLAYMLRLWRAGTSNGPVWRASLENPHTGERHTFADLEALIAHLRTQTEDQPNLQPEREASER